MSDIKTSSLPAGTSSSLYPVVCFGEVLWDILPAGPLPGGAPMNVAFHLKKLGTNPALITNVGLDKYGEGLVNMLALNGITTEFFHVDSAHPTGLVYANANDRNEVVYDIVFPSAWDYIEWDAERQKLVDLAAYFVFGSLTCRHKVSRETLSRLLETPSTKVLDINLRPPHFHRDDVEFLLQKADILKMNISELELITGWFSHFQSIEDRINLMQEKFGIQTLIVTMGGDGAVVKHHDALYEHTGFKVSVVDTIGSGDSFLAGFLHQLINGVSMPAALEFASGIGAFVATQSGACPDYDLTQIASLIQSSNTKHFQTI